MALPDALCNVGSLPPVGKFNCHPETAMVDFQAILRAIALHGLIS
ncbi:hypothetical protein [Chitinilyticum aquatile]|nr:hypothetical protein [Chitinilyticum aquatile]